MHTRELDGATFRCLEGCGFCCTFQPEVSRLELGRLRKRLAPRPVQVATSEGRTYLALQNKCGGCTLLERRGCTQYDLRPQHCRYFPFHVHFADEDEVNVNYTCRGVVRAGDATDAGAPGRGDLHAAFRASVLDVARPDDLAEHQKLARETYAEFRRRAQRAGAWSDADDALRAVLAEGAALFAAPGLDRALARGREDATVQEAHEDALGTFGVEDVARRPFYLDPALRWLTFAPTPGGLRVLEMDEKGALAPAGDALGLDAWADLDAPLAEGLAGVLARLARRRSFVGSAYALVDDADYATTVEEAVWARAAEVAVDLALRARILRAMGAPEATLADETDRFYDSTFLDAPTIGGWL